MTADNFVQMVARLAKYEEDDVLGEFICCDMQEAAETLNRLIDEARMVTVEPKGISAEELLRRLNAKPKGDSAT